jgi:hypothetical protein
VYKKPIFLGVIVLITSLILGTVAMAAPDGPANETNSRPGIRLGLARLGAEKGRIETAASILARLTGIDVTEISKLLREGKSIAEIAEDKGIGLEALVNSVIETRKQSLENLVQEGKITQERADLCLEEMADRIKENLNRTSIGPANGRMGKGTNRGSVGGKRGFGRKPCLRNEVSTE